MPQFHVFLKAPTLKELREDSSAQNGSWKTVICPELVVTDKLSSQMHSNTINSLPPATFEEASRRISRLYENIIFRDTHSDGEEEYAGEPEAGHTKDIRTQGMSLLCFLPIAKTTHSDTSQLYRTNDLHYMAAHYR